MLTVSKIPYTFKSSVVIHMTTGSGFTASVDMGLSRVQHWQQHGWQAFLPNTPGWASVACPEVVVEASWF